MFEEFRKLSPEERIKKLRQLEAQKKWEIASAEKIIKDSEQELEITKELKSVPIPQIRALESEDLFFSPSAKEIFKQRRQTDLKKRGEINWQEKPIKSLEQEVEDTPIKKQDEFSGPIYGQMLDEMAFESSALRQFYKTVSKMVRDVSQKGYVNQEEMGVIAKYQSKLDELTEQKGAPSVQELALKSALEDQMTHIAATYKAQKSNPKDNPDIKYKI